MAPSAASAAAAALAAAGLAHATAPVCTLHLRIQRCAGLRSAVGAAAEQQERAIDCFVVARVHGAQDAARLDPAALSSSPPATPAAAITPRQKVRGGDPCFSFDCALPLGHASDVLSLAVCDAAAPPHGHGAAGGGGGGGGARRIIGAVLIPLADLMDAATIDRWFDLLLPASSGSAAAAAGSRPSAAVAAAAGGDLAARWCPDVKPGDVVLQVAPEPLIQSASASNDATGAAPPSDTAAAPIGRIRVQMFATGTGIGSASASVSASSRGSSNLAAPSRRGLDRTRPGCLAFPEEKQQVLLHVVTWNAGNAPLPEDMRALLPASCWHGSTAAPDPMPDVVAIALQECSYEALERDLSGAPLTPGTSSCEASIVAAFTRLLPSSYVRVRAHSLGQMRLLLFVLRPLVPSLRRLTLDGVATGVANVLANKGMTVCTFALGHTSVALVCGHLAAHSDRNEQRNKDLATVARAVDFVFDDRDQEEHAAGGSGMRSGPGGGGGGGGSSSHSPALTDFLNGFCHVFLFGDLNYRLEYPAIPSTLAAGTAGGASHSSPSPPPPLPLRTPHASHFAHIVSLVRAGAWDALWQLDQLRSSQRAGKALVGFCEGQPDFPPSFKVLRHVGLGYTQKRLPSYCDRILWRSVFDHHRQQQPQPQQQQQRRQGEETGTAVDDPVRVRQLSLRLAASLTSSDHKPVTSTFALSIFWKAGRTDHARGAAELLLGGVKVCATTTAGVDPSVAPAAGTAIEKALGLDSGSSLILELRAAFLPEPLIIPWGGGGARQGPAALDGLALPLAYNNPARMVRELVLLRMFKRTSLGSQGSVSAGATPLARGLCVLEPVAPPAHPSRTDSDPNSGPGPARETETPMYHVERYRLRWTMLRPGGSFAMVLGAEVTLRWKKVKGAHLGASTATSSAAATAAAGTALSRVRTLSSTAAAASAASGATDSDDDDDDDDEEEDDNEWGHLAPVSALTALPVLRAKPRAHRSALVAQGRPAHPSDLYAPTVPSASASASSFASSLHKRGASGGGGTLRGALELLGSGIHSVTRQLRREHMELQGTSNSFGPAGSHSVALAPPPTAACRTLTVLLALFISSEESFASALRRLMHAYYHPLMRLAREAEAEAQAESEAESAPGREARSPLGSSSLSPSATRVSSSRPYSCSGASESIEASLSPAFSASSAYASLMRPSVPRGALAAAAAAAAQGANGVASGAEDATAASATPTAIAGSLFSSTPLLALLHSTLCGEAEAQLRLLQFPQRTGAAASKAPPLPFPALALQYMGELLRHLLPLFSCYRLATYTAGTAAATADHPLLSPAGASTDAGAGPTPSQSAALERMRAWINEADRAAPPGLDLHALLSLPLHRLGGYKLFVDEVVRVLRRLVPAPGSSAPAAAASFPSGPDLPSLFFLYSSLSASFARLQAQALYFQERWYASRAALERAKAEEEFYARFRDGGGAIRTQEEEEQVMEVAREQVGSDGSRTPTRPERNSLARAAARFSSPLRPSTAAVLRPYSACSGGGDGGGFDDQGPPPTAGGLRPATSYGPWDEQQGTEEHVNSEQHEQRDVDRDRIDPAQLHMLASKVQMQLRSSTPLAGFHSYSSPFHPQARLGTSAHPAQGQRQRQVQAQDDSLLLDYRGGEGGMRRRERHAAGMPPLARSLSLSTLDLFEVAACGLSHSSARGGVVGRTASASAAELEYMVLSPSSSHSAHAGGVGGFGAGPAGDGGWSIGRVCSSLGVGPPPSSAGPSSTSRAAPGEHWSSVLPPAFRKLQAGRALLALVDLRPTILQADRSPEAVSSPSSGASSAAPLAHRSALHGPASASASSAFSMDPTDEESLYDDEAFLPNDEDSTQHHHQQQQHEDQDEEQGRGVEEPDVLQSIGTEMMQRVLAVAGKARGSATPHAPTTAAQAGRTQAATPSARPGPASRSSGAAPPAAISGVARPGPRVPSTVAAPPRLAQAPLFAPAPVPAPALPYGTAPASVARPANQSSHTAIAGGVGAASGGTVRPPPSTSGTRQPSHASVSSGAHRSVGAPGVSPSSVVAAHSSVPPSSRPSSAARVRPPSASASTSASAAPLQAQSQPVPASSAQGHARPSSAGRPPSRGAAPPPTAQPVSVAASAPASARGSLAAPAAASSDSANRIVSRTAAPSGSSAARQLQGHGHGHGRSGSAGGGSGSGLVRAVHPLSLSTAFRSAAAAAAAAADVDADDDGLDGGLAFQLRPKPRSLSRPR